MVRKSERRRLLAKARHRWKDNIKVDLKETGWGGVVRIHVT
jgi:hypothetical protein